MVSVPPLVAYFVTSEWQWPFGLVPTYWPVKVAWLLQAGDAFGWVALAAGLAYQGMLIALLLRRINAVMHAGS